MVVFKHILSLTVIFIVPFLAIIVSLCYPISFIQSFSYAKTLDGNYQTLFNNVASFQIPV